MVRPTARFSPVIDISHAGIGGGARCLDAESLQRAPKSPPDASWTDPFSRVPSVDPATRRSPSHRTGGSKATRSGGPFRLRASRLVGKRDPKVAPPPNRFTRGLPGPWTFPSIGIPTRWADRPKAATPRTVPPKGFPAHRPFRLHASRSDGRGPEGFRPAGPFRPKASWPARPFRPRASGSHGAQSEDRIPRRHG